MNSRLNINPASFSNSASIRQEIQRFESVHPSIYAIYDLVESIPDNLIQQQLREHVVCIEDSFVNSQEWTLSQSVPQLKLGILGTVNSGKSALVHRYLTATYLQEESPEGGRFKKEVVVDGQSYLLLIRDEGGLPELQFTQWVDAVIFVFSLENELSFNAVYSFFAKMSHFYHITATPHDIPIILVGTQDAISESNPRVIDDSRARKLASDLNRCPYFETCATYGLNVERIFQDACQKIIQSRATASSIAPMILPPQPPPSLPIQQPPNLPNQLNNNNNNFLFQSRPYFYQGQQQTQQQPFNTQQQQPFNQPQPLSFPQRMQQQQQATSPQQQQQILTQQQQQLLTPQQQQLASFKHAYDTQSSSSGSGSGVVLNHTPFSTVDDTYSREFHSLTCSVDSAGSDRDGSTVQLISENNRDDVDRGKMRIGEVGVGRVIPIKQGILLKRRSNPLSKDWKKKYVTLLDDGRLVYHPSLHDYMENVKGKEISLLGKAVKIPGHNKPRGSEALKTGAVLEATKESSSDALNGINITNISTGTGVFDPALSSGQTPNNNDRGSGELATKKKNKKNKGSNEECESLEFLLVSMDNKSWHFQAQTIEEREEWVGAIEQQLLSCLQSQFSDKCKITGSISTGNEKSFVQKIRNARGNDRCADCGAPNPTWASLNLGTLVCIECSGIHRNLGSHLSKIRSLELDDWPNNLVQVMTSIGNSMANSIWQANLKNNNKPDASSPRDEKERWVRMKYGSKDFLASPPYMDVPLPQQLIDAIARQDIHNTILVLAYCSPEHVNVPYSSSDTRRALHIAAALANLVLVQLLLWHGANPSLIDHEGYNALFYARSAGSIACADLLRVGGGTEGPTLPRRKPPGMANMAAFQGNSASGGS